ncbi:MAG: ABC transporter ATP-binding protein [Eubacterium sp.]|nr:ABC transporter ATP-binding protein [Eubacterium sp.]
MLKCTDLTLSYKKKTVLSNVYLNAEYGNIIGLLGLNGSGKSTLLHTIAGIKKPDSGEITLNDINSTSPDYRKNFGLVTQENPLIEELSAIDNLRLWTKLSKAEIMEKMNRQPYSSLGVASFIDTPIKAMSGGMKKRLSILSVLINDPRVLLLDEPFAALDLVAKKDISLFLSNFAKAKGMVIIASHEEKIFDLCSTIYLLKNGTMTDIRNISQSYDSLIDLLRN